MFALLAATNLRSNARNRRKVLNEIATVLAIAKARAETTGDYAGLLGGWLRPGAWREKWDEIVSGRTAGIVARVAAARGSP